MPLPITNARLKKVAGGGTSGGYRDEPGPDSEKWEGNAGAFVEEKMFRTTEGNVLNRLKQTSVVIPGDLKPKFDIEEGDSVTYTYQGKTFTREVERFEGWFGVGPKIVELFFQDE